MPAAMTAAFNCSRTTTLCLHQKKMVKRFMIKSDGVLSCQVHEHKVKPWCPCNGDAASPELTITAPVSCHNNHPPIAVEWTCVIIYNDLRIRDTTPSEVQQEVPSNCIVGQTKPNSLKTEVRNRNLNYAVVRMKSTALSVFIESSCFRVQVHDIGSIA